MDRRTDRRDRLIDSYQSEIGNYNNLSSFEPKRFPIAVFLIDLHKISERSSNAIPKLPTSITHTYDNAVLITQDRFYVLSTRWPYRIVYTAVTIDSYGCFCNTFSGGCCSIPIEPKDLKITRSERVYPYVNHI